MGNTASHGSPVGQVGAERHVIRSSGGSHDHSDSRGEREYRRARGYERGLERTLDRTYGRTASSQYARENHISEVIPPLKPWTDVELPTPEKYRNFQGGPIPKLESPMVPQADAVYDLLDGESDVDMCPTCLEEYSDDNPKITAACGHAFHLSCILEWANRSDVCPFFCAGKLKCPGIDIN